MEIILSHANMDFDALGAMLAAAKLYPDAVPVLPKTLNRNVRDFLALYRDELPFRQHEESPKEPIDRLILVDTQSLSTPKGMHAQTRVLILDHHPLDRPTLPTVTYDGEPVGAATSFLVHRMREQHVPLKPVEASLLLLGIYEDTGNLTYATTTSRDVLAAGWLLEHGASLDVVNDFMHRPLTQEQRDLYETLERRARSYDIQGQSVIVASARSSEYIEELSTIAHKLNDLFDPDASFIIVGLDHHVQVIARSRSEAIDVAHILRSFGGGGHSKAAAALVRESSAEEIEAALLASLRQHVRPPVTVRQIMSKGVHTLSPEMRLEEAALLMQRWGHEGFPVAREGRLLGMLTRREVDRAMQHHLGNMPVQSYMRTGPFAVSADEPVAQVRQKMMEHDLGQIPVVEGDRITGIVTRTDVIRLLSAPRENQRPPLADRMREALPPNVLNLLQQASQIATDMGYALYLVGGFVRDLLLGMPNLDMDLVVEGDAILLAQRLAAEIGGSVRTHGRFGTAKWFAPAWVTLPESRTAGAGRLPTAAAEPPSLSLDFVTARTEFYEHPEALPTVEASSLRQDLYRRDFTINTMALRLDQQHFGQLVDFYGGEKDLENRLIRVLHNLSFVEDATRMLRAVRLEQRLGFRIEKRTEELMLEALDLLDRVSGERLRHELYLSLAEAEPERLLVRMQELHILERLHPALCVDDVLMQGFRSAREGLATWHRWGLHGTDGPHGILPSVYLSVLTYHLSPEDLSAMMRRLSIVSESGRLLREVSALRGLVTELGSSGLSRSGIYRLLKDKSTAALFVVWVMQGDAVRQRVELYVRELRQVKTLLNGRSLRAMGVAPGPILGQILADLLDARLDGKTVTLEEEQALARELIARARTDKT
jgi:tRNA nucleotidyltransferase (CCA-adding enzyme)